MGDDHSRSSRPQTPAEWIRWGQEVWLPLWMWSRVEQAGQSGMSSWTMLNHFHAEFPGFANVPADKDQVTRWFYMTLGQLAKHWECVERLPLIRPACYRSVADFDASASVVARNRFRLRLRHAITQEIERHGCLSTTDLLDWVQGNYRQDWELIQTGRSERHTLQFLLYNLVKAGALDRFDDAADLWEVLDASRAVLWYNRWLPVILKRNGNGVTQPITQPMLHREVLGILLEHPAGLTGQEILAALQERTAPMGLQFDGLTNASVLSTALGVLRREASAVIYPPDDSHSVNEDRLCRWYHKDHVPCLPSTFWRRVRTAALWVQTHLREGRAKSKPVPRIRHAYLKAYGEKQLTWLVPMGATAGLDPYLKMFINRAVQYGLERQWLDRIRQEQSGSYLYFAR